MNASAHLRESDPSALARTGTLTDLRGRHGGETIIVCGCGPSLHELTEPQRFITIGVNDVGRLFDPTYLVVVNPRSQFKADRFRYVEESKAQALFTQLDLGHVRPPVVVFRLGQYAGTGPAVGDSLHYTQNSPYVAVCLAACMGATRIGLIGVDLTEHHFFAKTGKHPLAGRLAQIDREYGALAEALHERGVELVNLSATSRLQGLPRARVADFVDAAPVVAAHAAPHLVPPPKQALPQAQPSAPSERHRLFVVNYRFLSCGDVFADGLRHAAHGMGLAFEEAAWDDALLPAKIERFKPNLLLVVHGRRFAQKWRDRFKAFNTAVWLVDEPYEVDDTAQWSTGFDTVFVNDPATLARHHNAHYLPVCFDPAVHRDEGRERIHAVGFIGGYNATRERFLVALAEAGLLGYVVGGPWRTPAVRRLCLSANIPAQETARLYQQTEIVLNVFRETHHFNAQRIAAGSMNPRIYEAVACGAAVLTERRAEVAKVFPPMPQFDSPDELVTAVKALLADRARLQQLRAQCREHLAGHAYRDRLERVLATALRMPIHAEGEALQAATVPSAPAHADNHPAMRVVAPAAPRPRLVEPAPFITTPRRNLIYHVWPVRGSTWRWNLDELIRRIDLFNGRRVIGIVCDERSEDADAVQAYLQGHGCEFVVMRNDQRGESATFGAMLARVESLNPDELSFYAHAKGVKYEPQFPRSVKRWAEVQYAVTLDDWLGTKEQLQRLAMTGIFRKHGRFANHQNLGDWHYSGTFFWMRHASVFSRNWQEVPQFYGGVEAWPGMHFSRHETGCMLLDNLRELPYQDRFWASKGDPAVQRWKGTVRSVPVPPDLARPLPFDGHTAPRLEQKPEEFALWIDRLLESGAGSLLTVGSPCGGAEWHVARVFHEHGRSIAITTLDAHESKEREATFADARARFGFEMNAVVDDSSLPGVRDRLAAQYDAVYIDGDHGYLACSRDLRWARSLNPRLIGLHDIVDSDWHAASRCCVSRVWSELKHEHETEEMQSGVWGGVGLIKLPRRTA